MFFFKIVDFINKFIRTVLYKVLLFNKLKVNPFRTYLDLRIRGEGTVELKNKIRSKTDLSISVHGKLSIGEGCFFNNGVSLNCNLSIVIGDNCLFGESVKVYDHNHKFRESELIKNQGFTYKPVIIGNNVWIGSNTIILPGSVIGDNVVVGAGSIISSTVPSNMLVVQKRNTEMKLIK